MLLGYLEQAPLYDAINFSFVPSWGGDNQFSAANTTVSRTIIGFFLCPSDGNAGATTNINSYSASYGTTADTARWTNPSDPRVRSSNRNSTGMFTQWASYGIQDCKDGTSQTIAYSEHLVGDGQGNGLFGLRTSNPSRYRGNFIMSPPGGRHPANDLYDAFQDPVLMLQGLQVCEQAFQTTQDGISDIRGHLWCDAATGYTMFNVLQTPNDSYNGCRFGCSPFCDPSIGFSYPASSAHPGGVNVCFADGSVRFIKDTIDQRTWWSLGTKNGGEVVSSDSY